VERERVEDFHARVVQQECATSKGCCYPLACADMSRRLCRTCSRRGEATDGLELDDGAPTGEVLRMTPPHKMQGVRKPVAGDA